MYSIFIYIVPFILSILAPVSPSYALFQMRICTFPDLCERSKCTSVRPVRLHHPGPVDSRVNTHTHTHVPRLRRSCVCVCRALMHSDASAGAYLDSIYHALSNKRQRRIFVPSMIQPPPSLPPPTNVSPSRSNAEARMKRVGEMKKRRQDVKRVEHKTGTGGRLSSLTAAILPRTASHALTYAWRGVCCGTRRLQMRRSLPKLLKEWEISAQKESFQRDFSWFPTRND